jgi:cyclomaltodextrinase
VSSGLQSDSDSAPRRGGEPAWVADAVWWRLYPLGFVGVYPQPAAGPVGPDEHRLRHVIAWLDHVVELGASGIALGPVFASAGHGYDTLDHLRIDPRLGTEKDFDDLVDEARRRGLRLQLDGVFNHVGREHPRARDALRDGPGSRAAAWFRTTAEPAGLRFVPFEGHDSLVSLDHDNPEVEDYVVTVMRHWLDRGADAWRLDAAYAVPTRFWARVLPQVRATHPDVWFEAEVLHGDYAEFVRDSTADTVTQYELWKAIWSSIDDHNFHELDWSLRRHNAMLAAFAPATFIGNHDVTRVASRIADARHLPHAAVLLAMLGGTPTVYAGDEYALRGVKEDRFGGDDAIRPEFPATGPEGGWPSGLPGTAEEIFWLYRLLIELRRRLPWLHRATSTTLLLSGEQYVIELEHNGNSILVALNLADQPLDTSAPVSAWASASAGPGVSVRVGASVRVLAADAETVRSSETQDAATQIAPHGWAVLG